MSGLVGGMVASIISLVVGEVVLMSGLVGGAVASIISLWVYRLLFPEEVMISHESSPGKGNRLDYIFCGKGGRIIALRAAYQVISSGHGRWKLDHSPLIVDMMLHGVDHALGSGIGELSGALQMSSFLES